MKHVQLKWNHGEEAICPECGNRNACLHTGNIGNATIYECRDCHKIFVVDNSKCPGHVDHDKNMTQDAIVVTRTLGKNCYKCGSFNIVRRDYKAIADSRLNAKNPWEVKELVCNDCGQLWG